MKQVRGLPPVPATTPEQVARVRRLLAREPDAETLLQMLGLAPYRSARSASGKSRKPLSEMTHGARRTYGLGCRCDACKAAASAYAAKYKPSPGLRIVHGTRHTYDRYKCRCEQCRSAKNAYDRERYRRQHA